MKHMVYATAFLAALAAKSAPADWTQARCDIYLAGSDHTNKVIGCTFSQRQGYVSITRDDGVRHELTPVGDLPGTYHDQHGYPVTREDGLANQGLIYRFPEESVFVYWSTAALEPVAGTGNPTAPFSTAYYDATTTLRCRKIDTAEYDRCPAGILRMDAGQASIVIQSPAGEEFTINFMHDFVNATNRTAETRLEGDTWIVVIDEAEVYEVPLAAIEGG